MKRDMDLVRRILLAVEEQAGDPRGWIELSIPGYSKEVVSQHVAMLADAGLLTAQDLSSTGGYLVCPKTMTWEGHDFLDAARNDSVWNKVRDQVKEKLATVPFEVLKALLMKAAASTFGLSG